MDDQEKFDFDINSVPIGIPLGIEGKRQIITAALESAAKPLLYACMMCGLNEGIETKIINDPTGEEYILSFKKVAQ